MMLPSITVVTLLLFTKSLLAIPIEEDSSNNDNLLDISEDYEEDDDESEIVECETIPESNPLRNGLGDDSLFLWPDKKIPFIIGDGFNETNRQNILESIEDYNTIFSGCIQWIPKTDEVMKIFCNFHLPTIWLIAYFCHYYFDTLRSNAITGRSSLWPFEKCGPKTAQNSIYPSRHSDCYSLTFKGCVRGIPQLRILLLKSGSCILAFSFAAIHFHRRLCPLDWPYQARNDAYTRVLSRTLEIRQGHVHQDQLE